MLCFNPMIARRSAVRLRYRQEEGGVFMTKCLAVSEYNKLSIAAPQIQSRSHLIYFPLMILMKPMVRQTDNYAYMVSRANCATRSCDLDDVRLIRVLSGFC